MTGRPEAPAIITYNEIDRVIMWGTFRSTSEGHYMSTLPDKATFLIPRAHHQPWMSQVDFGSITSDLSLLSSLAIIFGALFVIVQLRQNNKLIEAANEQARAAAIQAKLTNEQMKQNNDLANMDLIMRLYEFANSAEFQSAWLTVLNSEIHNFQDFLKLPKQDQVSFYQIGALFESLGVLVERGIVRSDVIEDMFLTELAWESMRTFVIGMRKQHGEEENYLAFERLYNLVSSKNQSAE